MSAQLHVFISYKKLPGSVTPDFAINIADTLEKRFNFEVFIDDRKIATGDKWAERIYSEISRSDVLVLLLEPETAKSDWVQREVDFARGAGVSIIPLRVTDVNVAEATEKLALSSIQYSRHFQQSDENYELLADDIRRLALDTRDAQRQQYRRREDHWYQIPTDLHLKQRTFCMKHGLLPDVRLHMTVGNIMDMPPGTLDVIVNSENDYLQMARFYEVNSLSARIRKTGAYFRHGRLFEDTVQGDLLQVYTDSFGDSLPVQVGQVLVTKAGHPLSELHMRKRVKFIFHAITVRFAIGQEGNPVQALNGEQQVTETIASCFEMAAEVNQNAELRASVDPDFTAIRSIAFPMFGAGRGSLPIKDVAEDMIVGFYRVLSAVVSHNAYSPFTIRDIHLLVYSPNEVKPIEAAFNKVFEAVPVE